MRRNVFVIVMPNSKKARNAKPLHHLQMPDGAGLIVSNSNPSRHSTSGRIEFVRSSRRRSLSIGDQSGIDSRRNTTTTPAKPARATATCAAALSASPGSMDTTSTLHGQLRKNYFADTLLLTSKRKE